MRKAIAASKLQELCYETWYQYLTRTWPSTSLELNSKNLDTLMQKLSENETRNTTLQKKIAEWKLQVHEYKRQMLALRETSKQKKTALKKAIRSQKQRAECFEAAVENLTSRIREREVKLSEILSASDVWKSQHDRMVEGKTTLEIQIEDLKNESFGSIVYYAEVLAYLTRQITSLLEDLKKKEEWRRSSDEEILGKLNSVNSENEKIYLENEKLKVYLATLENSAASVENELLNLQEKAKLQENLVEQYKNQVQKLQTAVEELKSRCGTVLNENKRITENKCLEVDKVRDKTEAELKELEQVCDLLKAAEEKQQEYQENLISWERIHTQKCKTLKELQVQASSTRNELSFSHEEDSVTSMGSHSLEEEIRNIQKKYEDLKRQLEKMEFQNEELACQLKKEDENLQCSKLQLEEKITEYNGLTRQLESALEEGRKMNEKYHEVCLKELENSLQKSENKNHSIQNYVQFLKASYVTMFG
ncbi:hypothetical protein llap_1329 [Limosa lapponica baueri]|uniref:Outer dense fiber protein 2-like n=1 Tax=Limosa lapponica baueri TaxID=1758121 RepID=A0A2I0UQL3_LIMLA|nr:hypothetical protein llap_1329 [Limosa lapponica baueri]